ncbi:hypothetical protein K523DRAFT_101666 [Schizophyllum commune Tattone D]|nr:hypothetical protein K523DRAFT_101666 [Schizophyllum commune Tattone D]
MVLSNVYLKRRVHYYPLICGDSLPSPPRTFAFEAGCPVGSPDASARRRRPSPGAHDS